MLSKQFRLNLRKEKDFFDNCKKVHTPYFSLFYISGDSFQTAIIVSKKIAKLATQRNNIKRKFRTAVSQKLDFLSKFKTKLVIVVNKKGTLLSVSEISQHLEKNAQKIRI